MTQILVVEDSPTQAAKLELYLFQQGWQPVVAKDAEAALDLLEQSHFDAVISDIVMPGMSGYDLCRKIKGTRAFANVPVILLTSLRDPTDIVLGLEAGADNFFTKPYDPEQLIKRVESVLENRQLAAEGKLRVGFEVAFLGRRFSITSERQQILDLLISTFEQIVETNQQLERTKQEIAIARDQAEEAARVKANFLAAMSHEIRTPMNGIVGMVDLLSEGQLTDDQRKMISTIKTSAYSLLGIIGDILDFSKLEAGRMKLESSPIVIDELLESIGISFWQGLTEKDLKMTVFYDPRIPQRVLGDPVRIRQILSNLVGNAVKFTKTTPERTGRLWVRAELLSEVADRVRVRFSVADNGIGMDEEVKSRLFRPFEQASASTVRMYGGTGLGLSICKQLVGLMNGEIHVESEPNAGTTFSVDLWLDRVADVEEHVDLSGIRVLNIMKDPNASMTEALVLYAQHVGGVAESVSGLAEAIGRLSETAGTDRAFNVVVITSRFTSDEQMATRMAIQALPDQQDIRFITMTSDYQRAPRMTAPNTISMTAAPLCYSTFIKAISIAAGRASPNTLSLADQATLPELVPPTVDEASSKGQLILVAEDNETNQLVIRHQMARLGYAAVIVDDGEQAWREYQTGKYGLLLTDCHMPNMNGYELTLAIRGREQATGGRRLPILAITANALHGEAERCLATGMDDFIVKPIELRAFRDILRKWMPTEGTPTAIHEPPAEPSSERMATFDVSVLSELLGNNRIAVRDTLAGFERSARRQLNTINAAFVARSAEGIAMGAHALKSPARTIGAAPLADFCAILETAANAEDWKMIQQTVPELPAVLDELVVCINAELTRFGQAGT